ncbi:hypothetical protein Tco_0803111 [Tanacetum coccineum]|uniref:Uncharacterized protein n=1 Tax=Tanacetum coccineum TaxID=301880 RepID=A0ABQ5A520_9ASTR
MSTLEAILFHPSSTSADRKDAGSDKPKTPQFSSKMLWGIVTQTNVDHAELIWEEFTQGIQTFFSHKASHKASLKNPKKKATPLLIPYGRFSKVIIYYLASNNNIHRRPDSAVHHTEMIMSCRKSQVLPLKKTPQGSASMQPATKRATPKKPTTTTPVKQSKPAPSPTKKPSKRKLPQKIRKGKPTFHLVDEEDEAQQESNPQEEGVVDQGSSVRNNFPKLMNNGKGKAVCDKDQDEVDTSTVTSGVSIPVSDPVKAHEALAGPDPEPMEEDQTGSDSGKLHVSLAGPNPEHMNDEFPCHRLLKDDQEKSKAREESDSTIPDPSHQTETSTPPVIAPFHKLRVARLEQEMSEVKKTDHSADVLATIRTQVPTAVDNYLGTKLDDSLLKVLERHTANLIEKYSVLPGPSLSRI